MRAKRLHRQTTINSRQQHHLSQGQELSKGQSCRMVASWKDKTQISKCEIKQSMDKVKPLRT